MIMEKKLTKKDYYAALRAMVEGIEMVGDIPADEVLAFIDKTVEQIDAKAAKAKEKAAEKKTEGDELRAAVQAVLTDELQTIDAITAQVEGEDITKSKVTARLTQLVKADVARKEQVKDGDRKVMGYALKGNAEAPVEEEVTETEE
jgi:hypothetical protein